MNLLLRAMAPSDRRLIEPHLTATIVAAAQPLASAGRAATNIVFPATATILLRPARNVSTSATIGIVGCEGAWGWWVALGCREAPFDGVAGPGGGLVHAIAIDRFEAACGLSGTLRATMLHLAQAMADQLASTAACGMIDPVGRRLARWLLMLHDRQDGDDLALTHDDLAEQIGARRASVTDCLHLLEGDHIVRCARGRLVITDRARLEAAAGASYGIAEARYRALIGPFGRGEPVPDARTRIARELA